MKKPLKKDRVIRSPARRKSTHISCASRESANYVFRGHGHGLGGWSLWRGALVSFLFLVKMRGGVCAPTAKRSTI